MTTVPELILLTAADHPDRVAVVDAGRTVTYAGLVERARRWRAALDVSGTEPLVAVLRARDVDVPAAQLGIWLAGGAYLPLAPGLPAGRIADVLSRAGCGVVITTPELAAGLPAGVTAVTSPAPSGYGVAAPEWDRSQLAYVISTSGSTGRPKGVAVEHGNLASLMDWYCPDCGLTEGCRVGMFNGLGFDATVADTWAPLSAGGQLHIPAELAVRDLDAITAFIAERGITQCLLATPLAELLIRSGTCPPSLRTLVAGGDRLRVWPSLDYPAAVHNMYGPTEGTVAATATGDLRAHPARTAGGLPPIGSPRGRFRVRLRDGELWISGPGVARGYHRDPELTADAFVANGSERWYRTGDLCTWTAGGELDFGGRRDGQVKLRGFRIELGEIEQAMLRVPGVRQATTALVDFAGEPALAAWFSGGATESGIRRDLSERLPAYMVPTWITEVAAMPLTTNGKIDRSALSAPNAAPCPTAAPEGSLAAVVAESWREVLGTVPDQDSDFFALGGHSLRANQVTVRLRERLGLPLALDTLFDNPRFDSYVAAIERPRVGMVTPAAATASGLPVLVVYGPGSATPHAIALAARDLCRIVFLADLSHSETAGHLAVPPAGTEVMDIAGGSEREACRRASALRPAGVVTFSDGEIPLAAAVAKRCGLPFHDPNTAQTLVDKFRQRQALHTHGVQSTGCAVIRDLADIPAAIERVGIPAVLKPRAGARSVDACLVLSISEAGQRFAEFTAHGLRSSGYVLEEYLPGDPTVLGECWGDYVSVETAVHNGQMTCLGVTGKLPMVPPFRESGMFAPAPLNIVLTERILALERAALTALGIRHGLVHTEVKLTPNGPKLIEVNGRMGGHVPDLLRRTRGIDLVRLALQLAMGNPVDADLAAPRSVAFHYLLTPPDNSVRPGSPDILDALATVPGVDLVDVHFSPDWTPNWRAGTEWLVGTVFGTVPDHAALRQTVTELNARMATFWLPTAEPAMAAQPVRN